MVVKLSHSGLLAALVDERNSHLVWPDEAIWKTCCPPWTRSPRRLRHNPRGRTSDKAMFLSNVGAMMEVYDVSILALLFDDIS